MKALLLLAALLGQAAANGSCAGDLALAGADILKGAQSLSTAVTDCENPKDHNKCVADISAATSDLNEASTLVQLALQDCGGSGCQADLTKLELALQGLTTHLPAIAEDCDGAHKVKCAADLAVGVKNAWNVSQDAAKASQDCKGPTGVLV